MEKYGKFFVFLGILCIFISIAAPGIISSEDPEKGYILFPLGIVVIFIGILLNKTLHKRKGAVLDLSMDESAAQTAPEPRPAGLGATKKPVASKKYSIAPGYSYARDMLTAHIHKLSSGTKTMEILGDLVGIMDEYAGSAKIVSIGGYNILELAQFVAERRHWGFEKFRAVEDEAKIIRPFLAGLKAYVLICDCGVHREEVPNSIRELLQTGGPPEVDDVIRYLLDQFGQ